MSRRLIPLFLALLVGAGGCDLEPITSGPPGNPAPGNPTPDPEPTVPSTPEQLETHAGPGMVTLSWSPPKSDGGSALTGYRVSAAPREEAQSIEVDGTTARVTGLRPGATYFFYVGAVNAVGEGLSTRSEAVTLPDVPGAPPRPSVVRGDGQVRVNWTEPGSDERWPITGYLVTAHPQGLQVTADASARSAVVGGLSNGEASTFTVRALNAVGEGLDSPASLSVVPATVPSAPASVEATVTIRRASITWSPPASTGGVLVRNYVVTLEPDGLAREVDADTRGFEYSGLKDGTAYTFTVAARNEVGEGPELRSASVRTPGVPARPGAVSVTAGIRSATVTWEAPAEDGGAPLTGYVVESAPSGTRVTVDASVRTATFPGLSSTKAHTFGVSATNILGSGPSTVSAAVRPLPAPAEVTDLQVETSDAGCLTVSYALSQPDWVRADVSVEVDATGSGTFSPATQAGSTTHEGLLARHASPEGVAHQFLWNRAFDVPGAATVRVRLSARVPGATPGSATLERTLPAPARRCELRLPTSTVHPLNTTARRAVKGDFNGDGKLDLVVVPDSSDTVSILLGLGNGSFQPASQQKLRYNLNRLAAGDLDGDRMEELLWQDGYGNLWVARSLGAGLFADPVSYRVGYSEMGTTSDSSIVLADFDGNGSLDVATLGGANALTLGILSNTGDGTLGDFAGKASVASNSLLAVADLDEDGRKDVLVIGQNWWGGSAALLSNGDGTFRTRSISAPEAHALQVDDLDGDGHLDLVLAREGTSDQLHVHLLRGDGQGGFSTAELVDTLVDATSGFLPDVALTSVDMDRDGLKDMVVTLRWKDVLAVLRGRGAGSFEPAVLLPSGRGPFFVTTGDFDGDGGEDVASVQNHSRDVRVWRDGPESLSLPKSPGGALAQGDFNGDGKMDLVSASVTDSVQVHLSGGPEGLRAQTPTSVGSPVFRLVVGHVDGDETLDVVVLRSVSGASTLALLLGNGDGTLRRAADIPVGAMPSHAALGDVNGDGRTDLVCQVMYAPEPGYYTQEIRLFLGQGDGTFAAPTVVTTSSNPDAVALGDLDKDGALDMVVAQDSLGGGVLILKGRGDGTFLPPLHVTYGAGQFSGHIVLADVNGDGYLDVVRGGGGGTSVHVVTGTRSWMVWEGWSHPAGSNCAFVSVQDFDGDGRQDVLCANSSTDSVSLMRGEGSRSLAAPLIFGVRGGVAELGVFDVNGDGRLDILAGGYPTGHGTLLLQR
ncbi:FG-GAP-like repeat-containing protein [Archangium violaceum]|uniref:FG-GAP-like repeat-containing protein n=1 Tax=Archangium violaceum TaxID=83451 RepID=UPI0036D75C88